MVVVEETVETAVAVGEEWADAAEGGEGEARPPSRRSRYAFHETIIQNDTRSATTVLSFSGALGTGTWCLSVWKFRWNSERLSCIALLSERRRIWDTLCWRVGIWA